MIKFLDLEKQYQSIKKEMDEAISGIISKAAFIGGDEIKTFEKNFAAYHNTAHCVAVANGTDALEIAIEALNLPKGSEVIVPANSFIASSEAVSRQGYTVVFCDCDPETYTISIPSLKSKITSKTSAIVAVHLYGHPCDMDALNELAQQHDLKIIEDCAQSHGAEYKGKRIGGLGHISAFSFYPGKNLGAYGDAGAILTQDEALALRCKMIANHGRIAKYDHKFEGRNSRLDGIQAAVLNVKLKYLDTWTDTRRKLASIYRKELSGISGLTLPQEKDWAKAVYHLFVVRTEKREALKQALEDNDIQTGIHYPIALPKLEAYTYTNQASEPFFANQSDIQLLSLPMGDQLSESEILTVCKGVKQFFSK